MATSDKLNKLLSTKAAIKQAIIDKGVEVGEDVVFADYPNKIAAIEGSGSGPDYISLRTNNHTNYQYLFSYYNGDSLDAFELDTWDTSNVTTMSRMFSGCEAKDYNLGNWDFSKVTDTSNMFNYSDAVNIDLSNWTVNPELRHYNMGQMFVGCYDLETLDIRNLNITDCNSNPTTVNAFQQCNKLHTLRLDNCPNDTINKIITSTGFPTGLVDGETRKMWVSPKYVGDLTPPYGWEFVDSDGNEIVPEPEIPLYVLGEFQDNSEITEVTTMVNETHTDLNHMFYNCVNLTTINGIDQWDTSNVTDMNHMFKYCHSLRTLDLNNFDTSKVENMGWMFNNCSNLETLDIRNFDMSNLFMPAEMFNGCHELRELRLDNCNNDTIRKIIESSEFPTGVIIDMIGNTITRKMYVTEANVADLTAPSGWMFVDSDGEEIVPEIPVCEFCGNDECTCICPGCSELLSECTCVPCEYCGEKGCDGSCTYCPNCGNLNEECTCTCPECGNLLNECTCGSEEE